MGLKKKVKKIISLIRQAGLLIALFFRWHFPSPPVPPDLNRTLIVSFTSFRGRFKILHRTIKCLLTQSVRPDKTVLWISEQDRAFVPARLLKLQRRGLEIAYCEDIRSYTKLVPALRLYPGADIVIADDDIYYWRHWLRELVDKHKSRPSHVIAHQTHRIKTDEKGQPAPYQSWRKRVRDGLDSPLNFGLGGAGIYYPSGSFHTDVFREDLFLSLCPKGDDIWFYWMARLNGRIYVNSDTKNPVRCWVANAKNRLFTGNKTANDEQVAAMIARYGLPYPRP